MKKKKGKGYLAASIVQLGFGLLGLLAFALAVKDGGLTVEWSVAALAALVLTLIGGGDILLYCRERR